MDSSSYPQGIRKEMIDKIEIDALNFIQHA